MTRAEVLQLLLDVLDEVDNESAARRVRKLLREEIAADDREPLPANPNPASKD